MADNTKIKGSQGIPRQDNEQTSSFQLVSGFTPAGDQPGAIKALAEGVIMGLGDQVLLGVTGSGKTFTMAQVIAATNRPTLVMAPNKTLAAQLYTEFSALFPHNAVEYFVSYYDYYQPEAYLPHSDVYIEKDSSINEDIDKLRHAATHALLTRRDVIIVASVSCIYGLGSPEYYAKMLIPVEQGDEVCMESLIERLVDVQYQRNDVDFHRGTFRVRGDVLEVIPAYEHEQALRITFFGDEIDGIFTTDPLTGEVKERLAKTVIYPASHYVSDRDNLNRAVQDIRDELRTRLGVFQDNNQLVEAQRLEQKTQLDLEMIEELGYCNGIENYSLHLDNRQPGEPPATLLDYFPDDFLLFVDESHITIPQIGGMFHGDRSRKQTLVDFGFRLPSALDNRPLCFEEFLDRINQTVYVSATPGAWELERAQGLVIEQVIRPTGLLDPLLEVRPTAGQMDDLMGECSIRSERDERVLVTTLTKRMAEDLTEFLQNRGIQARYMHSDIDTLERVAILQALQKGEFEVLVGINLLREGLDLPEVSLVAILDADKEGFLRSNRSLIQTFGRAARNAEGRVIMYADQVTPSMHTAIDECSRRRKKQEAFNRDHGITPRTIRKEPTTNILYELRSPVDDPSEGRVAETPAAYRSTPKDKARAIKHLERLMRQAAKELEFETAAQLRDRIAALKSKKG